MDRRGIVGHCACGLALWFVATVSAVGQRPPTTDPAQYGPYNGVFLLDGLGLRIPVPDARDSVLRPDAAWTLSCWYLADEIAPGRTLLGGVGDVTGEYSRYLTVSAGKVSLWLGEGNELAAVAEPKPGVWQLLTATFDGTRFHLYHEGAPVATGTLTLGTPTAVLQIAPPKTAPGQAAHFGGKIAGFQLLRRALAHPEVAALKQAPPPFALLAYEEGSKPWAVQNKAQTGYRAPQDPATLPKSRAPFDPPVAIARPPMGESLQPGAAGEWSFADGWTMQEAPKVAAAGAELSTPEFAAGDWLRATVPGTVLTTLVDDGIYPDPDRGLNNLAIPESLNQQDYWYRNVFAVPPLPRLAQGQDGHAELTFHGINYQAEVWLNGRRLGGIKGAFRRGRFDVTALLKPGEKNALAVRVSPPPHPGIPQEQSVLGGAGRNGGSMLLDGPTFVATEGWDWVPAIRDRNTGIWQPVTLAVSGPLRLGDAQVVTAFENHDPSKALLNISVPVTNGSDHPLEATINAAVDGRIVQQTATLPPGSTTVTFSPEAHDQLRISDPRLWWPNGYGKPELYTMAVEVRVKNLVSDQKSFRFGVREVTYELSLLDAAGRLRRVDFTPAAATGVARPIVDVSHEGMRTIPGADAIALNMPENKRDENTSVVSSLAAGMEKSPAIREAADKGGPAPYLAIKVNGVRIAARGGNWGMDDARKRVSRARLEPFFRLHRDANLNMIRNWVGQCTEETFYELADEYGMMVWNDFWESTQNYNIEAQDPALFLDNAADTILHFRNHPSIVLWCGRNEGVPQPIINEGLEALVRTLDGTRYYSPSSNQVNLQGSGPYSYQKPDSYYHTINRGFAVETGTASMSTLEAFQAAIPPADQWPIGDAWAYHDWHHDGGGKVDSFMAELEAEFGAATSLADFERKAQMLNYVNHRAIFEGMNANLWAPNSGRLLWMTQPAWPSTMWQILSSDYDTHASYYGCQKACEPLHVQLNLVNYQVDVVNTTTKAREGLTVGARVYSLRNALLFESSEKKSVAANVVAHSACLALGPHLQKGMVLVELTLSDATGKELSRNVYWLGGSPAASRELNHLPPAPLQASGSAQSSGGETTITVQLTNAGKSAALATKLTLLDEDGKRILPAYYTDNYLSLLPGTSRSVDIRFPEDSGRRSAKVAIRGWNAVPGEVTVKLPER